MTQAEIRKYESFWKEKRSTDLHNVFQIRKWEKITNPVSVDYLEVHHVISTEVTHRQASTAKIKIIFAISLEKVL